MTPRILHDSKHFQLVNHAAVQTTEAHHSIRQRLEVLSLEISERTVGFLVGDQANRRHDGGRVASALLLHQTLRWEVQRNLRSQPCIASEWIRYIDQQLVLLINKFTESNYAVCQLALWNRTRRLASCGHAAQDLDILFNTETINCPIRATSVGHIAFEYVRFLSTLFITVSSTLEGRDVASVFHNDLHKCRLRRRRSSSLLSLPVALAPPQPLSWACPPAAGNIDLFWWSQLNFHKSMKRSYL